MANARQIERDPQWLPHGLDMRTHRMHFLRIERDALSSREFLADRKGASPSDEAWLPFSDVASMRPETGALHFIFHTAFCRSTLLVRALGIEGVSAGLSEPGIIAALASGGEAARGLVKPVLDLLSRPFGPGEAVFLKPTNHANMLAPSLLDARPEARAIVMTSRLEDFLRSVTSRGMLGRRWGRNLYLELMGYAPVNVGLDQREQFLMTDLQSAGLAWLLSQHWLAGLTGGEHRSRMRVLHSDRFDDEKGKTLTAIGAFTGLALDSERAGRVADGPLFNHHAKLGGDFAARKAAETQRTAAPVTDEEIAQVETWIGMIAQQLGTECPVPQTLF